MDFEERKLSENVEKISIKIWILFFLAWLSVKIPYLFLSELPLNADIAVHLMMAKAWLQGEGSKFMWGQNYLASLETLWIALWMRVFPLSAPWYFLPNLMLGLIADLLFLLCAKRLVKRPAFFLLMALLVFAPFEVLEPQIHPCYSYTLLSIIFFAACLWKSALGRGLLLGLAFYIQPISVYYIFPLILYYPLLKQWKKFSLLLLGVSIPLLFAFLPVAGPSMNLGILFSDGASRSVVEAAKVFISYMLALIGIPLAAASRGNIWQLLLGGAVLGLFVVCILKNFKKWKSQFQQMDERKKTFAWLMLFTFVFIPTSFMIRKYNIVDDGIKRYLWLWHYPFYFGICFLISSVEFKRKALIIFSSLVIVGLMAFQSLSGYFKFQKASDPNYLFKQVISHLRSKDIQGMVGDYWAVYPSAFFSTEEGGELIKAFPLSGAMVRKTNWVMPVSIQPRVAYLCWKEERWCVNPPPEQLQVGINRFEIDPSEPLVMIRQGDESLSLQIYQRSMDF